MDNLVAVQLAQSKPTPSHSEASLSARNLLAASREAADSSRENPALRHDNSLGIFQITPLRKTSKPFLQRRKAEDKRSRNNNV
jgi:hypothetical protein